MRFWPLFLVTVPIACLTVGGIIYAAQPPAGWHDFSDLHKAGNQYQMLKPDIWPGVLLGWCMMIGSLAIVDFLYFRDPLDWGKFKMEYLGKEAAPEVYMNCFFILFALMVVTGKVLTDNWAVYDPDKTTLKHYYGYNNICVVLDFPPATYVNPAFFSFCVAFMYVYAIRNSVRANHLKKLQVIDAGTYAFVRFVDWLLCIGSSMFALCLSISPDEDILGHTLGFLAMLLVIPFVWWSYLAQAMACQSKFPAANAHIEALKIVRLLLIFMCTVVAWAKFAGTAYALFFGYGQPVRYEVAKVLDSLWLLCFFLCPMLFPSMQCPQLHPNGDMDDEKTGAGGPVSTTE